MSANFQLNAVARESKGTSVSRKLRRAGQVPAMVYGAGKDNQQLLLNSNEIKNNLNIDSNDSINIGSILKELTKDKFIEDLTT